MTINLERFTFAALRRRISDAWFAFVARHGTAGEAGPFRVVTAGKVESDEILRNAENRLSTAFQVISEFDPVRSDEVSRYLNTILIMDTGCGHVAPSRRIALLTPSILERLWPVNMAGLLVNLAAYSRLLGNDFTMDRNSRRLDCMCLIEELSFIRKVPGTEKKRVFLHNELLEHGCLDDMTEVGSKR